MNSSNAQTALYSPLDASRSEIRVLTVRASASGRFDDPLSCSLEVVSLQDKPEYNALSYVWGEATRRKTIAIDNLEAPVTRNLDFILRYLRGYGGNQEKAHLGRTPLWVDAICINQSDPSERERQVLLMRDIYREAVNVLSWLGAPDAHSDWALGQMNDPGVLASAQTLNAMGRQPTRDEMRLQTIQRHNLDQRAYWQRAWILQELVVARDPPVLLCGDRSLPWDRYVAFRRALPLSRRRYTAVAAEWDAVEAEVPLHDDARLDAWIDPIRHASVRDRYAEAGAIPLAIMLVTASKFLATDARDHVYGIMSLISPAEAELLRVDYESPPAKVFRDAWTAVLHSLNSGPARKELALARVFPLLSWYSLPGARDQRQPSWVPDLASQRRMHTYQISPMEMERSGWREPCRADMHAEGNVLHMSGYIFDTVAEADLDIEFNPVMATSFRYGKRRGEVEITVLALAEAMAARGRRQTISASSPLAPFADLRATEPIWRTLAGWTDEDVRLGVVGAGAAKNNNEQQEMRASQGSRDEEEALLWELLMDRHGVPDAWVASFPEETRCDLAAVKQAVLMPFIDAISRRCHGRRAFLTKSGFLGLGTLNIEAGDVVILLEGMTFPSVLRPVPGDDYTMVGFAYISGLMDWDLLDRCMAHGTLPEQDLKIL